MLQGEVGCAWPNAFAAAPPRLPLNVHPESADVDVDLGDDYGMDLGDVINLSDC